MKNKKYLLLIIITLLIITGLFAYQKISLIPDTNSPVVNSDNDFSHLSYYHEENLNRYQAYQQKNPSYSIEDIVTHVNMGIDNEFYSVEPIVVDNPDNLSVLINKYYKLPDSWEPDDLIVVDSYGQQMRQIAAAALQELASACEKEGFKIHVHSGYRSTTFQQQIYDNMISTYGQEYTDKYVSRPGQSEHTTGLSADISINDMPYEDIESSSYYTWFVEHLEEYGFILRYLEDKDHLTGYSYESWHIRYVGKEEAKKVNASGLTYDEYIARQ